MYERLGLQFFRTTTRIQWGSDAFDELRLVTTFVTRLGVKWILYHFISVLERKPSKVIPESSRLRFLKMFSTNKFALSDTEHKTPGHSHYTEEDLPLLKILLVICQNSGEQRFCEKIDKFGVSKFDSLSTLPYGNEEKMEIFQWRGFFFYEYELYQGIHQRFVVAYPMSFC